MLKLTRLGLLAVMLVAGPAYAQTPAAQRPYRGLFGGGNGTVQQGLTLDATAGAGYSRRVLTIDTQGAGAAPGAMRSNGSQQGSVDVRYSLSRDVADFSASVGSAGSYYAARANPFVVSHYGNFNGSLRVTESTRVSGAIGASYQPIYFLGAFPALAQSGLQNAAIEQDVDASVRHYLTSSSSAAIQQRLTTRASASFNYRYNSSQSPFGLGEVSYHDLNGRLNFSLAKGLGVRAGYGYSQGSYDVTATGRQRVRGRFIDAGVDFNRSLSVSRSMTLGFGTGLAGTEYLGRTEYRLIGNVRLNREIGRTWNAGLRYSRNVEVLYTFQQPVFSDALVTSLSGLINRRLLFRARAGVSKGDIGFVQAGNDFTTISAGSGVNIGLTRLTGLSLDYSYSRYVFGAAVQLPSGLLQQVSRQSVRINLTFWLPLFDRTRRLNASR